MIPVNIFFILENLSIANTNKSHFNSLCINYFTQELIIGDDLGGLSFIKIFNKSEIKKKVSNQKIICVQNLEIFNDQEHIFVVTEDIIEVYRIKRETKIINAQYHNGEIIKIFTVEPIKQGIQIIEDAK